MDLLARRHITPLGCQNGEQAQGHANPDEPPRRQPYVGPTTVDPAMHAGRDTDRG